jgi:AcrR family transcriptional regulator
LQDAALELFGTKGFANTSIGELCRVSYVTTRYFYEEYGDRERLLLDLYDRLVTQVGLDVLGVDEPDGPDRIVRVTRARLSAFVHSVVADERAARVILLESGSPALEARRREAHQFFAAFVAERAFPYADAGEIEPRDYSLLALCFVGAVNEAVMHWMITPPDDRPDIEHVIDTLLELYLLVRRGLERKGHDQDQGKSPG